MGLENKAHLAGKGAVAVVVLERAVARVALLGVRLDGLGLRTLSKKHHVCTVDDVRLWAYNIRPTQRGSIRRTA